MATFTRIQSNLTADDAREVGSRTSFQEADYYLDGQEPVHIKVGYSSEDEHDEMDDDKKTVKLGGLLSAPEIAQTVIDHEKTALLAKKRAGAVQSTMRDRPNAPNGQTWEWDHWQLSLSKDETAWLAENPDKEEQFREIVADAMRIHPNATGTRQALITGIHKDTGAWHVQGLVSRYAIDNSVTPPKASVAVDMSNNSSAAELIRQMQDKFNAAGMPFNVSRLYTNEKTVDGQPKSKFEDRGTSDAAKEAYRADVEAAGGAPGARTTVGTEPEKPFTTRAISSINPEISKLELGARLADDDGLKAAQRVEALKAEIIAAEAARAAAAERKATFDQAIAAIGQKEAALAAQALAEANAAKELEARELAEKAKDDAEKMVAELESEKAEISNSLKKVEDDLTFANDDIKAKDVVIAGEPERIEAAKVEAVTPVQKELDAIKEHASREPERQKDAITLAIKTKDDEISNLNASLKAEETARKNAETELQTERSTFEARAREWAENNITTLPGFSAAIENAVDKRMEKFEAMMRSMMAAKTADTAPETPVPTTPQDAPVKAAVAPVSEPPAPVQETASKVVDKEAAAPAKEAEPKAKDAEPKAKAKGQFFTKHPDDWTDEDRKAASERFAKMQEEQPQSVGSMNLVEWAIQAFEEWKAKRAAARTSKPKA